MKQTTKTALAVTTTALAVLAGQPTAHAQSADTLIDKLVEKGVLTTKEAKDLRQEADNDFSKAYAAKTGMPDWVTSMKLGGDLRLRYDGIYIDNPNTTASDRNRLRYRLRFGPTFNLFDNVEVGIRLGSGENKNGANPFGDPISGNDSYTQNGGKKPLWIDHAYVKWTAINTPTWGLSLAGGKMESPFQLSDVLFDPDYTPEGFAAQLSYQVNDNHLLKFNNGFFALSEISSSSKDSYLLGTQLRWDAAWSKQFSTSLGLSLLTISDPEQLATVAAVTGTPGNQTVPNVNQGNLRAGTTGTPRSSFNPYVIDAAASYTLESFPSIPDSSPSACLATMSIIQEPTASATAPIWRASRLASRARRERGTCPIAGSVSRATIGLKNLRTPTTGHITLRHPRHPRPPFPPGPPARATVRVSISKVIGCARPIQSPTISPCRRPTIFSS